MRALKTKLFVQVLIAEAIITRHDFQFNFVSAIVVGRIEHVVNEPNVVGAGKGLPAQNLSKA